MKKWTRYEVIWLDSCHTNGWQPLDSIDAEESLEQMTLGYFIGSSKRALSFAQSAKASDLLHDNSDTYVDSVMTIPKRAILKTTELKGA